MWVTWVRTTPALGHGSAHSPAEGTLSSEHSLSGLRVSENVLLESTLWTEGSGFPNISLGDGIYPVVICHVSPDMNWLEPKGSGAGGRMGREKLRTLPPRGGCLGEGWRWVLNFSLMVQGPHSTSLCSSPTRLTRAR